MKLNVIFFFMLIASVTSAQNHVNLKKGFAAQGYDVVAYFSNEAIKGDTAFSTKHQGINYKFVSSANLSEFKKNPNMYIPQYGGYCAYAVAHKSEKIGVNPKTFQITDGKLYLFYNSWGVNTLEEWNNEGPEALTVRADKNWKVIVDRED